MVLAIAAPAAGLTIRTVAVTGDVAPGTDGATYDAFGPVVLNHAGEAAFTATLTQGGAVDASNDLGMWSEGTGALALIQRRGSPAVGTAATWDAAIAPPVFNDAGQVAFHGTLSGTGVALSNDRAVWVGGPVGALALAAREGDTAPGAGGATFTDFEGTLVDSGGDVAFRATLSDGGSGIWAGPAGAVQLAARDGSAAAGTPPVSSRTSSRATSTIWARRRSRRASRRASAASPRATTAAYGAAHPATSR